MFFVNKKVDQEKNFRYAGENRKERMRRQP